MAIGSGVPYNSHTGNGVTRTFAYGFTLLDASDLVVTVDDVPTSAYTVAGLGDAGGGSITFTVAPANGAQVLLLRVIELIRATDYQDNGDLLAGTLNDDIDRLWMALQQNDAGIGRALRAPELAAVLPELPSAADRADRLLGFNSAGDPTVFAPADGSAASLALDLASSASATKGAGQVGYAEGLAYPAGTAGKKLQDIYSTTDAASLDASVARAYSAGGGLYFPRGTIASAASIPNLHDVQKFGYGSITRGTDVFYITPTSAQTNRLYVSASGSNTNDGLSAAQPMQTLQRAFDVLASYGPSLPGAWEIILAAGTYTGGATFPENVRGQNRVLIRGPLVNHPNVPTAIIDGGGSQSFAINFNGGNKVTLSNLLLRNCTTYGMVSQDLCDITTVNVHVSSISGGDGLKMQQGRLRVQGGIIQTCGAYGINVISGTTITIGDGAVSLATGPQIKNCTQGGILAQENTTGHSDYVTIDNCAVGLDIVGSSRVHAASSSIINNATAGVRCRASSHWFNNGSTLTGNAANELLYGFSQEIGSSGSAVTAQRVTSDTTQVSHTGITAETTLKTYSPGVRSGSFVWPGRSLRVAVTGQFTGASGTKTLRVKVGGNLIHGLATASGVAGFFRYEGTLRAVDASNQTYDAQLIAGGSAVVADGGSRAIAMAGGSDQAITVTGQLSAAGDSIVISNVEVWETA